MNKITEYQLFISDKCVACVEVLKNLEKDGIHIKTVNVDVDRYELPFPIRILPALVKKNKLISYGNSDILGHFMIA